MNIIKDLWTNKKLIFDLAKNDFKTKYAGSYLGITWAFVQPVITVLIYWFVFEMALNSGTQATKEGIEVPYLLWLIAGLVPWFYFQDALNSVTNTLLNYTYLVKKVVFNISILPVVRLISAIFVHLFFIGFMLVIFACYGHFPGLYALQIVYYSFCMMVLIIGIGYVTSAIVVFFRDLTQVVNIVLQVGIWVTPIMWNIDVMNFPAPLMLILKANPMYYIVAGYRDTMLNKVFFWEEPVLTLWFWFVAIALFAFGTNVFKRLKVHFADVL